MEARKVASPVQLKSEKRRIADFRKLSRKSIEQQMISVDNPEPQMPPGGTSPRDNPVLLDVAESNEFSTASDKLVIIMVGLPARGKTFIARKLLQYLGFFHAVNARVFNMADYRRRMHGAYREASWFNPECSEGAVARQQCHDAALDDLSEWLEAGNDGRIAILDGTHATLDKREYAVQRLAPLECKVIMIESICSDDTVIERNIKSTGLKASDYAGKPAEEAIRDFRERVGHYEAQYETLDGPASGGRERDRSWMKIVDSRRFVINNIRGYTPSRIIQFVSNLHQVPHVFYLCRHGQSEYNVLGKIGGDSGLSPEGDRFARALARFAETEICVDGNGLFGAPNSVVPARLWTSTLKRTRDTAQYIQHPKIEIAYKGDDIDGRPQTWVQMRPRPWSNLDELFAGICDGMTYDEIKEHYPDEFARRQRNKLAYRYPRGESYLDMIHRLDPMILEMERHREPLLIIAHQGVLRLIYAYYLGLPRESAPYVSIPIHTVIKLTPLVYECREERFELLKTLDDDGQAEPTDLDPPSH
ncbi:hypothetical protein CTAYLR_001110 [Chrysophaeum taylorii]|uniref:6-phosphofructo-2-kinase domain-containing protein n=1 Tax=Chrysophaeum taylorii TaxID=2483200 RepID=A0AAD7UPQ6_9STRA|nr:hypothetical protein CTAYLR_001110 [Chrysophaeum taylorii]